MARADRVGVERVIDRGALVAIRIFGWSKEDQDEQRAFYSVSDIMEWRSDDEGGIEKSKAMAKHAVSQLGLHELDEPEYLLPEGMPALSKRWKLHSTRLERIIDFVRAMPVDKAPESV